MHSRYDRIVWTVIALALALIALNPWLAPSTVGARSTMDVNIAEVNGVSLNSKRLVSPLPVTIVNK